MTAGEAREMLSAIPCRALNYQDWVNVGMALHNEGLPCALWDEWSQNDSRYHPGECEKKWRTFGNGDTKVTMGTVYHMAKSYGWNPAAGIKTYGYSDLITTDEDPTVSGGWHHKDTQPMPPPPTINTYSAAKDITDYLSAIFEPDDKVCYVVNAQKDDSGKWKPFGGVYSLFDGMGRRVFAV